jgi:hypothetical protein
VPSSYFAIDVDHSRLAIVLNADVHNWAHLWRKNRPKPLVCEPDDRTWPSKAKSRPHGVRRVFVDNREAIKSLSRRCDN